MIQLQLQQQQQQQESMMAATSGNEGDGGLKEKSEWGWNWLERWMASQPHHFQQQPSVHEPSSSYMTDDMSEKTVEMDVIFPPGMGLDMNLYGAPTDSPTRHPKQAGSGSDHNLPSYMAPTKSARAKARGQGPTKPRPTPQLPQWNSSTKRAPFLASACDSSSSGGGTATTTYPTPRSPSPKANGARAHPRRLLRGSEDWMLQMGEGGGWRHEAC